MTKFELFLIRYSPVILAICGAIALYRSRYTPSPLKPRDYKEIRQEGVLRFVTEYSTRGYFVEGDSIGGFQHDLVRAIAKRSGLEIQTFLETNLTKSFYLLDRKACDVIARNVPVTSELRKSYLFTEPILLDRQVLVQRTADANHGIAPIRNQLDLAGKTVYIPKDSPALLRLHHLAEEIGDTIHIFEDELYSDEQLVILVAHGDIDFAVCDLQAVEQVAARFDGLDIATDISFTQFHSWLVRGESRELLDSLNCWLRDLRDSGVYDEIFNRYYKH